MTEPKFVGFLLSAFSFAYFFVKKITFNELHIFRNNIADYRYFVVTGVCEPVLVYIRHYLEASCKGRGVTNAPKIDWDMFRRLGYDDDLIAEYEDNTRSLSGYFEKATLDSLYSLNIMNTPRLCEIDLWAESTAGRQEAEEHIKSSNLGDNLLSEAPYGAYCIMYLNTMFGDEDDANKTDRAKMRNIRKELDALCTSLENEDVRNTGRTSRLLWVDASVWTATRRGMYSWATDLLTDYATEEYLWECTGACGELTMLKGFYGECIRLAEGTSRLGVGLNKTQMRKTELYESLLYIDGRAFGWDALRYYADAGYKGRTLKSEVARSLQIEYAGVQNNTYKGALGKCMRYLGAGKRYITKLFKVRCLLECGSLSLSLGRDSLKSKECRELCKKYGLTMVTTEDLQYASKYNLFVFRDVMTILDKESRLGNRLLNDNAGLREVEEGLRPRRQPLLRVYLALGEHRKLVEIGA